MKKEYICACGKIFTNSQSFNAHKSHCKEHYLKRDGNLNNYYKRINNIEKTKKENYNKNKEINKTQKLEQWKLEEHRCEHCGKIMTEYYGSGRFCSRSCANTRNHSKTTKEKISNSIKTSEIFLNIIQDRIDTYKDQYNKNPKVCPICGKIIPLELKQRKTCSEICRNMNLSQQLKGKTGGYRHFSGHNKENKGYYKGIYCDSTWELAYVIYNIDHNIFFKRCTRVYNYKYNGEIHKYYPDFELEDGTLIEIKGYEYNDSLKYKIESVKDRDIQILRYDDLKDIFKYVIDTYGKDFKKLYDK